MAGTLDIENRILQRLLTKLEADARVPAGVVERLRALAASGKVGGLSDVLDALREGVKEGAKNSTS